jgi:hypothetical protein
MYIYRIYTTNTCVPLVNYGGRTRFWQNFSLATERKYIFYLSLYDIGSTANCRTGAFCAKGSVFAQNPPPASGKRRSCCCEVATYMYLQTGPNYSATRLLLYYEVPGCLSSVRVGGSGEGGAESCKGCGRYVHAHPLQRLGPVPPREVLGRLLLQLRPRQRALLLLATRVLPFGHFVVRRGKHVEGGAPLRHHH